MSTGIAALWRVYTNAISRGLAIIFLLLTFALPASSMGVSICLFYNVFQHPCPGCGVIRSLVSVSHLNLSAAWDFHPLGLLIYPALVALVGLQVIGESWRERFMHLCAPHDRALDRFILFSLVLFGAFGVARLALSALS